MTCMSIFIPYNNLLTKFTKFIDQIWFDYIVRPLHVKKARNRGNVHEMYKQGIEMWFVQYYPNK